MTRAWSARAITRTSPRGSAFSAFGAKPSRYPSSAEALISRVLKGQPLPRVNALVDLYNSVSVRHVVPLGGEDADRLEGPLRLTVAAGDEPFDPRGDGTDLEHAAVGEVVCWPACHLDRLERRRP